MAESKFDIIGRTKLWFTLSGIVIGIGLLFMIINTFSPQLNYGHHYPLKLGIDFTGGNVFQLVYDVRVGTDVTDTVSLVADIHQRVDSMTRTVPLVQAGKDMNGDLVIQVRSDETAKEKEVELKTAVLEAVRKVKADAKLITESREYVGPVIGQELAYRGILGLVIGSLLILVYISLRMSFDFAVCAIAALVHDVLVLCGVFAVLRIEIDSTFVAAILTVIGYSINDTIVIFDRIRENTGLKKGMPYDKMVNLSLLQTMARSINTSGTTMLPLFCLLFFGGPTIKNFSLALLVGIFSGTYSSIFNASPILVAWRAARRRKSLAAKETAYGVKPAHEPFRAKASRVPDETVNESLEALESAEPTIEEGPRGPYGPGKGSDKKKKKRKR